MGLATDSMYTARVFAFTARAMSCGLVASTKVTSIPSRLKVWAKSVIVPPYRAAAETMCEPEWAKFSKATVIACCPLETARAPMPPSRAAIRCSKTLVVGFMSRV